MKKIQVKYFGMIAEAAARQAEEMEIQQDSIQALVAEISQKYQLQDFSFQIALNKKLVKDLALEEVKEGDELAFLPPFSGG